MWLIIGLLYLSYIYLAVQPAKRSELVRMANVRVRDETGTATPGLVTPPERG
jgi:hypothetical protein